MQVNQRQNSVNMLQVWLETSQFHRFVRSIVPVGFLLFAHTPCELSLQRLMFSHSTPNITCDLMHSNHFKVTG